MTGGYSVTATELPNGIRLKPGAKGIAAINALDGDRIQVVSPTGDVYAGIWRRGGIDIEGVSLDSFEDVDCVRLRRIP